MYNKQFRLNAFNNKSIMDSTAPTQTNNNTTTDSENDNPLPAPTKAASPAPTKESGSNGFLSGLFKSSSSASTDKPPIPQKTQKEQEKDMLDKLSKRSVKLEKVMIQKEQQINSIMLEVAKCLDMSKKPPRPFPSKQVTIKRLKSQLVLAKHAHKFAMHFYEQTQMTITNTGLVKLADMNHELNKHSVNVSKMALSNLKSAVSTEDNANIAVISSEIAGLGDELADQSADFKDQYSNEIQESDELLFENAVELAKELGPSAALNSQEANKQMPLQPRVVVNADKPSSAGPKSGGSASAMKIKPNAVDPFAGITPASELPRPVVKKSSTKIQFTSPIENKR